jgi:oxalate---CoA ligase
VRAARKYKAAIAECYWNGSEVVLDVKDTGKLAGQGDKPVETAQPDDIALVLHTSGTTGRPKAVPLTHRNLTRTMYNIRNTYELTPKDRTMLVMPLFHVHGLLAGFLAPLASRGSVVVPPKFSASDFWSHFNTHKANWYTAVPTIHQILLKNPPPNPKPNIRFIRSCSSPLSPKIFHELEKTFDAPVLEAYAMTEAAHQMTSNPLPSRGRRIPGSVGIGQGVEVKILDQNGSEVPIGGEAEICIRGENVTKGYLNNPSANVSSFTSSGFFRTGDQGKMDKDGYVYITGRIKELINKGGEKISPIELDNVIAQNPAVSEAVSFAIEDEIYGQDVAVAVVLKDGKSMVGEELKEWMKERVAKFKLPKKVSSSVERHEMQMTDHRCVGLLHRRHAQDRDGQDPATNGRAGHAPERAREGQVVDLPLYKLIRVEIEVAMQYAIACFHSPFWQIGIYPRHCIPHCHFIEMMITPSSSHHWIALLNLP